MSDSQTILITGANRGIGLALARELLSNGHRVIATARDLSNAQALQELNAQNGSLILIRLDVNSDESLAGAVETLTGEIPLLDVLVNNAAIFPEEGHETLEEIQLQHFRDAFETNVLGPVRTTRAFIPLLRKSPNPRVVNISSGAGSISQKDDSLYYAYSTSKAALNMATRAMAAELKARGICVVALTPGWVMTDMGGPNAPLTAGESARSIAKTVTGLTMEKTSLFLNRDGGESEFGW